jgi:hypothetical protein
VWDLCNCFWLADVKHLAHEDQTAMNFIPGFLIGEGEIVFVSKERFVHCSGQVILEYLENQLVNDAQLNFVPADEAIVVFSVAVEGNNFTPLPLNH